MQFKYSIRKKNDKTHRCKNKQNQTLINNNITQISGHTNQQRTIFIFKRSIRQIQIIYRYECTIKSETQYHKSSKLILIELNITIPNQLIPEDPEKSTETLMDPIILFEAFYEAQNEIYKRKI